MLKSRSIRVAVNVCVIGALIAPVAGIRVYVQDECGEQVASTVTCSGCGHCSVPHAGDRCGCCSHAGDSRQAKQASGSMACCPEEDLGQSAAEEATDALGICMCGTADPGPAVPPAEGRTASELLVRTLLLGHPSLLVVHVTDAPLLATSWGESAPPLLLPRDAQRRLGVWRI